MTRLDILKNEREQIKDMHCLSFALIDNCLEWYDREIEAIEVYGAPNKEYGYDEVKEHYRKLAEYYNKGVSK